MVQEPAMTNGMLHGSIVIEGRFDGMLNGVATVPEGASVEIAGMINGTLIVERDATVRISGMVSGAVIDRGGTIITSGMVRQIAA